MSEMTNEAKQALEYLCVNPRQEITISSEDATIILRETSGRVIINHYHRNLKFKKRKDGTFRVSIGKQKFPVR